MVSQPLSSARKPDALIWDCLFLTLFMAYAWLVFAGITEISASGVALDSDLQTYAQGIAGAAYPENFGADPVLNKASEANSIPNLERILARILASPDNPGLGLLRAGALCIFIFYAGWYMAGRWLFGAPVLALTLTLLESVTVWVGWGTFWGINHSDPVPRVFFAAILPWLLPLNVIAVKKTALRPLGMFCAGLCMWAHGISALNYGAMLFVAYLFLKPKGKSLSGHMLLSAFCLIAFFIPVLIFLWPSLSNSPQFSLQDLEIAREVFQVRWAADYADFWGNFIAFFKPFSPTFILVCAGFIAWLVVYGKGSGRICVLAKMTPFFVMALLGVALFCWAESSFAQTLGRLPMGHELVRGMRFLVPLSWLMLVGAISCVRPIFWQRLACFITLAGVLILPADRQYMAAQFAASQILHLPLPLYYQAAAEKNGAENIKHLLERIKETVPHGESVFCNEELMAIRYYAKRPLAHTFKDGYVFFYNKDINGVKNWLEYERLRHSAQDGEIRAWLKSDSPWALFHSHQKNAGWERYGDIVWQENSWSLLHKKPKSP